MPRRAAAVLASALLGGLAALIAGCFPNPPPDDEGHATFAREVIPVLLGRRARGVDEVEAVADIAQLLGRDVAARMLMKDEGYVDHWADVLVDLLRIQRDIDGGLAAQDSACWGAPTRPDPDPAIAIWVRDHAPGAAGAPTPAWNMTDLLRSAIALDDLSVVYRANLFAMSMRRAGSNGGNAELTDTVLRTYLNRDITCLRCHNPTYSTSNKTDGGGNIVWRRLWTISGHPEKALFGNYYDATAATARIRLVMRGDVRKPATGTFGTRPWGMTENCARDTATAAAANNATLTHHGFQTLGAGTPNNPSAGFGSLNGAANPKVSLWELEGALRQGVNDLKNGYERFPASAPLLPPAQQQYCDVVAIFSGNCVGCHSGPSPSGSLDLSADPAAQLVNVNTAAGSSTLAKRVVAGNIAQSELSRRINAAAYPPRMPPGASLSAADQDAIDAWIAAGAPSTAVSNCNTSTIPDVHPDEAFAFLTAANLVDGIWMSAMGYRLTIDHGFPRNAAQRDMLWNLTEYTFVPNNWSLKAVLSKVVSSPWFARRAPTISQADNAYKLPPLLDPWTVADPSDPANPNPAAHERYNGQGELVNRFRVNTVLRTVAATLAWKEPRRFPGGGYPSPLDRDLGQYLSPAVPGFTGVNFQSLLALESQTGLCNKSGRSVDANDWVDKLVEDVSVFNTANPDAPITLGEVWAMLKDRVIQDPTIERALPSGLASIVGAKTEEAAVIALLNQGLGTAGGVDLNTPSNALNATQLRGKLREGCGVLVKTPEFLLTNVSPRGYSDNNMPDPPRLSVCMAGEPCGYPAACNAWRGVLSSMGHTIACEDRSVRKALPWFRPPWLKDAIIKLDPGPFIEVQPFEPMDPGPRQPVGVLTPSVGASTAGERASRPQAPTHAHTRTETVKAEVKPTALDHVRYRVEALCPEGLCGFLPRPTVQSCIKQPTAAACQTLLPPCDPRNADSVNYCGRLPADIHDPGVLVLWGEGAEVTDAKGARLLRVGNDARMRWSPLKPRTKLQAGDLVYVPLNASLQLAHGRLRFGVPASRLRAVEGIDGHMLAITGRSAGRLLNLRTKKGAMTPAELRKGVEAGKYETRVPTRTEFARAVKYGAKPESRFTPSPAEVEVINRNFDALHFGPGRGLTPDGRDIEGDAAPTPRPNKPRAAN